MSRIYLDNAATTPLSTAAREAMVEWLDAGNPSSQYEEGRRAKAAIDSAREVVSQALGCLFAEVVFTSSGTEAATLAIVGAALANPDKAKRRVLLGRAEHHCVLHTGGLLHQLGYEVELLPVDREARIDVEALKRTLSDDVLLVSVMHANNELGSVNPIREVAGIARAHGALMHVDAVQTFCRTAVWPHEEGWFAQDLDADLINVSGHKVHGPKGVGALYVRAGTKLEPLIAGGGQERELRGGTENVAAIAGFAAAVRGKLDRDRNESELRDRLLASLEAMGAIATVVDRRRLLPGHAHVRFPGVDAETLLIRLDREGVSASSGAACSSGSVEPSHVLLACGYSSAEAREGVRFTLGPETTLDQIDEASSRIMRAVQGIRGRG